VRKAGEHVTSYDLKDLETLNILKMDILGLNTVSVVSMVEEQTGTEFEEDSIYDEDVYRSFASARTDGIFQFGSRGAKDILLKVQPESFEELAACSALDRPAPIKLGVLDDYVDGKNGLIDKKAAWYRYTKETYGTLIYQEQVMKICIGIAKMSWQEADKVMKSLKPSVDRDDPLMNKFAQGAHENMGVSIDEAKELYKKMVRYLFNKSHAVAYTMMSVYQMWLLQKHPLETVLAMIDNENKESNRRVYEAMAVGRGNVVYLAHVNGGARYSIREVDGGKVLQQGMNIIKGVGTGTAELIAERGPYKNMEDLKNKVEKRYLRKNVIEALESYGALEFNKNRYYDRVIAYNATLMDESRW
jgi:DNA polymerase-3 subunit alpha